MPTHNAILGYVESIIPCRPVRVASAIAGAAVVLTGTERMFEPIAPRILTPMMHMALAGMVPEAVTNLQRNEPPIQLNMGAGCAVLAGVVGGYAAMYLKPR